MKRICRILLVLLVLALGSCHAGTGMAKTGTRLGTVVCGLLAIGVIDLIVRTKKGSKKE